MAVERISLELTPLDVLMFRDTRPFGQVSTGGESLLPSPRTVAGAVRTWLLRSIKPDGFASLRGRPTTRQHLLDAFGADARWVIEARLVGPFLCRKGEVLLPAPLSLLNLRNEGQEDRLISLRVMQTPPPGYEAPPGAPEGFVPAWAEDAQEAEALDHAFLSETEDIARFCQGSTQILAGRLVENRELWGTEPRLGIGIEGQTRASKERLLYASSFLRLRKDVTQRVDLLVTSANVRAHVNRLAAEQPCLYLGGERKVARVRVLEAREFGQWPHIARREWPPSTRRFLTYLATPGRFAEGTWYPRVLAQRYRLVSAVVGLPEVVPGWDVAHNSPLRTQYAVPAGAVHFWELRDGHSAPDDDPHGRSIADDPDDQQAGWGICLRGEWDYG